MPVCFVLDGLQVQAEDDGASLLEVLRDRFSKRAPKDGCSPQGQCGCCTVWINGMPRVACVTPLRRVERAYVTTLEGLDPEELRIWTEAFFECGASQCGFCSPGIIMRLAATRRRHPLFSRADIEGGLAAHLCRCTGWHPIVEAALLADARLNAIGAMGRQIQSEPAGLARAQKLSVDTERPDTPCDHSVKVIAADNARSLALAELRASIEGRSPQRAGPEIAAGKGGFADDQAPKDALVAVADHRGGWAVAETLHEARALAAPLIGRRGACDPIYPIDIPDGTWQLTLQTTWVEPAYMEPDSSWCYPDGEPVSPLANGGAFGGKLSSLVAEAARELSDAYKRPVRVLLSRDDLTVLGPKRPPMAAGINGNRTGILRVARTPGVANAIASILPGFRVEEVDVAGPPTSASIRGAGWVESLVLLAGLSAQLEEQDHPFAQITSPDGARATARFSGDGTLHVIVDAGDPLDEVVLRSYCIGAAHMAIGWVRSESLGVSTDGVPLNFTIRSLGIIDARRLPSVEVEVARSDKPPVNGSDAVFAAVAAATWIADGLPSRWPTRKLSPRR